ncbi:MAG: tetratricopeptide repeat protein [Bacteroidota bacterium]
MKKLLIPVLIVVSIVVVLFFRSGPRKVETVASSDAIQNPEISIAPSKENVTKSFTDHVEMLKKKIARNPNDIQTLKTLAQWLMDAHKTEEAIGYFERGVKLQPGNDSLLLDLSVCYFQIRQYDMAMKTTDRILRLYPDHPRALLNKGAIYASQNKPDTAAAIWNRLIQRSPETEEAEQAKHYLAQLRRQ